MNATLKKSICMHRGLGKENTTTAIKNAIKCKPYMVEFDIQNINNSFYLGHPPTVNYESTLEDALILYTKTNTIPKIDTKCNKNWEKDINLLLSKLENSNFKILVNIGGEKLNPAEFMKAEMFFAQRSKQLHLINVDIARYAGLKQSKIVEHLKALREKLFSMSPMLEGDFKTDINIAHECGVEQIHFWSNNSTTYTEDQLTSILNQYKSDGFNVLFDINLKIVVPNY